ncbi:MAG: UbiH/UbiF/VisC/COQ6 family ubiquinone biosynthesis hydroxylase [Rhodospirillaceae bacterium]|nr:UbiH/UbiF/VisC/COQ6 family ubiquinone biosynthesis hydroxylase [Rhodospirillaceae bacterium]
MSEKAGDSAIGLVECEVAIVGGGMVGLTLGVALAGAGVETVVIDVAPAAARIASGYDGRSSAIALGSQRALEGIGLWARLADVAQPILDIRVSDGSTGDDARHAASPRGGAASHLFLHYDHRAAAGGTGTDGNAAPFGYIVENRAIRTALIDAAAALPNLLHLAPASLASETLRAGHVELTLEDGRQIRTRLLIGADGRNSRVRESRGIGAARWDYAQTGIVCTVTHELPHDGVAHEHFLPAGPFAVPPMTDDEHGHRSSIVWTERKDLAPAMLTLSDDEFSAEMMRRFGSSLGAINLLGDRKGGGRWSHPLGVLHADRYTDRRMALIGDAAHGIHPIAGQGLNLGLRDVAALAETIVDARRIGLDIGVGEPLERYARWRRVDNLLLIAATDSLNRLFANDVAPVRLARDLGLAAVDRMPAVKRFFMRQAMGLVGDLPRLVKGEAL